MPEEATLHFPDRLIIQFVEEDTQLPILGIATDLTVFATRKNDYHLGPGMSDFEGVITISRDWVKQSIEGNISFASMDYSSPMEQCYPYLDLKVMSVKDIERAMIGMRIYEGFTTELGIAHGLEDLKSAANYRYEPKVVRLQLDVPGLEEKRVVIRLKRTGET